jgi:hypothetical protein
MRLKWVAMTGAALAALVPSATKVDAGPSMSSAWLAITVSQDECIRRGSTTMKDRDFETRFEVLGNTSIYGELKDYTALIRCAADKGIVYFVVAGPTGSVCSKHMNAMRDNF